MRSRACFASANYKRKWRQMGGGLIMKKKVRFAKISMENKDVHILRKIIPQCEEVEDVETLLLKSIEYVIKLKLQVSYLRGLYQFYGVL
ncbi:uncharacterized protein LOC119997003 [Tripterygium wilfordii]|uniref:uncharacterized protein LOC119997003 n=1 Tax=Tripterygium wilfordii TaxID=458696 RepID=UPI0018F8643B|nr:uncharacterized protein LOC119997003 [Tripterygium wilfordii]